MSPKAEKAVGELLHAEKVLRSRSKPLTDAIADHLHAQADYWRQWFPEKPTRGDLTTLALARAAIATLTPEAPDAGTGTRQQDTHQQEASS